MMYIQRPAAAPAVGTGWAAEALSDAPNGNGQGYSSLAGKVEVVTPTSGPRTAVIVIAGQSYGTNSPASDPYALQSIYAPTHGAAVTQLNVYDGKFYVATDPLLGISGIGGTMWTRMADDLISSGKYDSVVLVPVNVGGSSVNTWAPYDYTTGQQGVNLGKLETALHYLQQAGLDPTQFIWQQGIADSGVMPPNVYDQQLMSIFNLLRANGMTAPIYSATNSVAFGEASPTTESSVAFAAGQQAVANQGSLNIHPGVNFDLLPGSDYSIDGHFTTNGLTDAAGQWSDILGGVAQVAVGNGELVARLPTSGATSVGVVKGTAILPKALPSVGADWHMVGVGRLDGATDVIMQNAHGQTAVQLDNGAADLIPESPFDSSFILAGMGDFNGDGNTDLVYQQSATGHVAIQNMAAVGQNGGGGWMLDQYLDSSYKVVASGDNKLVYRQDGTNAAVIQFVDGLKPGVGGFIQDNVFTSSDWRPLGFADARDLGSDNDLIWANDSTGQVAIQYLDLNALACVGGGLVQDSPYNPNFQVVGFEDANHGVELLWQDKASGQMSQQFVQGLQTVGGSVLSVMTDNQSLATMFGDIR